MRPHDQAASVFSALGDATRLQLLARLGDEQPLSIRQLSEGVELTRQGVTKHLKVLEQAGLVRRRKAGRESRYQVDPAPIESAHRYLETVSRQWDDALDRLKHFVET